MFILTLKQIQMKNIHLIPTDKPSRLHLNNSGLVLCDLYFGKNTINGQNIYITNDEEIKEGDWCIHSTTLNISKHHYKDNNLIQGWKKIILTTDQDLIKDGVQAIDDEFLEWFVNNPSCEEVDVCKVEQIPDGITFGMFGNDEPPTELIYKIIIPQEEPKQEIDMSKYISGIDLYGTQETLEEAARNYINSRAITNDYRAFTEGAKWQAERMYSEEEVIELLQKYRFDLSSGKTANIGDTTKFWFEQFKKK